MMLPADAGARRVGYAVRRPRAAAAAAAWRDAGPVEFTALLDAQALPEGGVCDVAGWGEALVAPQLAFVLGRELAGPGCHVGAVLAATDFLLAGLEFVDARAPGTCRFAVGGTPRGVEGADLRTLGMVLERNGEPVAFGAGAAVLGHPAAAVARLARQLAEQGASLPAGCVVLSGGITAAVPVKSGDNVAVRAQGLGAVTVRCG